MEAKIKKKIKSKFRTIRRFIEVSGLERKRIEAFLSGRMASNQKDEWRSRIIEKIDQIEPEEDPRLISDREREWIRMMILIHWNSMANFSREEPEFSPIFLSNLINGRRRLKDEKIKTLLLVIQKESKRKSKNRKRSWKRAN